MMKILEHKLVPNHEIMSDSEIDLIEYDIDQLPKILDTDPVVKEIGAKEGDILRITRDSQTAGTFVTYRHVIASK